MESVESTLAISDYTVLTVESGFLNSFFFQFLDDISPFHGAMVTSALSFKARVDPSRASSPVSNGFLRFH